ncbi:MAG: hypothetical protein ABW252_03190 [Polyangiales bacterium]
MNTSLNTFVVVSADDSLIARARAAVADLAIVHVTENFGEAVSILSQRGSAGLVVDGRSLATSSTGLLTQLRAEHPLLSILFVATELTANLLNELQPLRIEVVARPLPARCIEDFAQRALSSGRLSSAQVGAWIEHLALAHKLDGTDIGLFPLLLERETKEQVCARLSIDQETLTRDLRRLVKKCRVRNTDRLAKNLMRDALLLGSTAGRAYVEEQRASA